MSDDQSQSSASDYDPDADPDTDATMTAPSEGRPDHAEVTDAQEEEQPADE